MFEMCHSFYKFRTLKHMQQSIEYKSCASYMIHEFGDVFSQNIQQYNISMLFFDLGFLHRFVKTEFKISFLPTKFGVLFGCFPRELTASFFGGIGPWSEFFTAVVLVKLVDGFCDPFRLLFTTPWSFPGLIIRQIAKSYKYTAETQIERSESSDNFERLRVGNVVLEGNTL